MKYYIFNAIFLLENSPHPSEDYVPSSSAQHLSSGDNSTSGADMPNSRYASSPQRHIRVNGNFHDINVTNSSINSPDHGRDFLFFYDVC